MTNKKEKKTVKLYHELENPIENKQIEDLSLTYSRNCICGVNKTYIKYLTYLVRMTMYISYISTGCPNKKYLQVVFIVSKLI